MATKKKAVNGEIEGYIVVYRDGEDWDVVRENDMDTIKSYYEEVLHVIPVETMIKPKKKIEDLIGFTVVV